MSKAQAYECDGPACSQLAPRALRAKSPAGWLRITIASDGDKNRTGSFDTIECAHEWVDQQLGDREYPANESTMVGEVNGNPASDDDLAEATF